jgi:uncharacterized protein (DUF885 family)
VRILIAAALAAGLLIAAPSPAADAPGQKLRALFEAYWQESLALDPLTATFLGDHRYDDRLPNDLGQPHIAQELSLERRFRRDVALIDAKLLGPEDRLSQEVFLRDRDLAIEGFRYEPELLPFNQFRGLPQLMAQLGSGNGAEPFRNVRDYENWLKRIDGFAVWVDQAIANMRRGAAKRVVQPKVLMERVLPQLTELVAADPTKSVFYQPVAAFPAAVPANERARLRDAYASAIAKVLNPAYLRLRDFIRDEYLPETRASIAFSELPLGRDWYAYSVRVQTTTRLTPEAIHALGQSEVKRIGELMDAVAANIGFKGERKAFLDSLRADPRFFFEREADLLDAYRALKDRVRARLPEQFDQASPAEFEIRAVESFRAKSASSAAYQDATPDGSRPGIFYVNTYDLKSRPKYLMEAIYLHEAEPGHHFQGSIALALKELPSFRRFGDYAAYSEGWGLYAESLGRDLGLYTDPYYYFGALSTEIWRAARLVIDTGIHAKGWTRQQAIDYLLANTAIGASDATAEVERYIAIPGQALSYKVGELKIKELKARAQRELGARYDVRLFHHAVLGSGALPLDVLEAEVNRWIASRKSGS